MIVVVEVDIISQCVRDRLNNKSHSCNNLRTDRLGNLIIISNDEIYNLDTDLNESWS